MGVGEHVPIPVSHCALIRSQCFFLQISQMCKKYVGVELCMFAIAFMSPLTGSYNCCHGIPTSVMFSILVIFRVGVIEYCNVIGQYLDS